MSTKFLRGDPLEGLFPEGSTATSALGIRYDSTAGFLLCDGHCYKPAGSAMLIAERAILNEPTIARQLRPWFGPSSLMLIIAPLGNYQLLPMAKAQEYLRTSNQQKIL